MNFRTSHNAESSFYLGALLAPLLCLKDTKEMGDLQEGRATEKQLPKLW